MCSVCSLHTLMLCSVPSLARRPTRTGVSHVMSCGTLPSKRCFAGTTQFIIPVRDDRSRAPLGLACAALGWSALWRGRARRRAGPATLHPWESWRGTWDDRSVERSGLRSARSRARPAPPPGLPALYPMPSPRVACPSPVAPTDGCIRRVDDAVRRGSMLLPKGLG